MAMALGSPRAMAMLRLTAMSGRPTRAGPTPPRRLIGIDPTPTPRAADALMWPHALPGANASMVWPALGGPTAWRTATGFPERTSVGSRHDQVSSAANGE